jgi:hypothetical protein
MLGSAEPTVMDLIRRAAAAFRSDRPMAGGRLMSGGEFLAEFREAEVARKDTELRWLNDLRQFKGQYEPEELAKMAGRSKAFSKKTRSKVRSINARMMELVFPTTKSRTYEVKASPEPTLPPKVMQELMQGLLQANGGNEPPKEVVKKAVVAFATKAAEGMATRMDDQLAEIQYRKHVRAILGSGHIYGTGILKGPLVERRDTIGYVHVGGKWTMQRKPNYLPFVEAVPIWRCYPDMAAVEIKDCRYVFEDHLFTKSGLLALAQRGGFNGQAIRDHVTSNPTGLTTKRAYQDELRTAGLRVNSSRKINDYMYTVLERWGWIEHDHAAELGLPVTKDGSPVFGNVWLLPNGEIIKAIVAPIEGIEWPYQFYYFDKDESSIFGEGLPAVMRDDQKNLNAATRALLDNAAVCAGPQFEVFKTLLADGEDVTDMHSFRIWLRTGGDPQHPAIRAINADAHIKELSEIAQMFDNSADEVTAIPKFWYGENPTQGAAGTASGLSMLISNSNIALKDQVVCFDEGITSPFITALYRWNMRFSTDDDIKGDYDIEASGASSLVSKEIRGQMMAQFAATLQPEERQFLKFGELVRARAAANDIEEIVMTDDEAEANANNPAVKAQQEMVQLMQQLGVEKLKNEVAAIAANAANTMAEAERKVAEALNKRVEAVYAAMQAAGVVATNTHIAPVGDVILREAGWKDAPQGEQPQVGLPPDAAIPPAPEGQQPGTDIPEQSAAPVPEQVVDQQHQMFSQPESPHIGQEAGIETARLTP